MPSRGASAEDHFSRLARLLEWETEAGRRRASERAAQGSPQDAERTGECLVDLALRDLEPGLGGCLLSFAKARAGVPLPWTRLLAGSPVVLNFAGDTRPVHRRGLRGVVAERSENVVRVVVAEQPDDEACEDTWRIDACLDEVAAKRQWAALENARAARGDRLAELRAVLLGDREPRFRRLSAWAALDNRLDASQQEAVKLALSAEDVALIHGPPGTGKTTAVVELIRQAVKRGEKVLACAPSNLAVDNLLEKLVAWNVRVTRLGHPARVLPKLREHSLDLMTREHPDVKLARKLAKEAWALFRGADKYRRAKPAPGERREKREEARSLLADARRLEEAAAGHILDASDVVCATNTSVREETLGPRRFDLVVIDEACQASEPSCWIPLARAGRIALAGDHCQLPPTVLSRRAAKEGFDLSLFERLVALHGETITRRLDVQYRMREEIMRFSSNEFYGGTLAAHPSVAQASLRDLLGVAGDGVSDTAIEFIDTAGVGHEEEVEPDGESRFNRGEAEIIVRRARALLAAGVAPGDVAIIAPYAAQTRLLRETLAIPALEIDTVDGFQGREKEVVLMTFTRSNRTGEIGFLEETRRVNVAWTRARRKLIVVGDSATLSAHPFYARMIEYCESIGAYRTVWEEPE